MNDVVSRADAQVVGGARDIQSAVGVNRGVARHVQDGDHIVGGVDGGVATGGDGGGEGTCGGQGDVVVGGYGDGTCEGVGWAAEVNAAGRGGDGGGAANIQSGALDDVAGGAQAQVGGRAGDAQGAISIN